MLDGDLAILYVIETKRINGSVRTHICGPNLGPQIVSFYLVFLKHIELMKKNITFWSRNFQPQKVIQ